MNVEEKISSFLKQQKIVNKSKLGNIKMSLEKNKNDENLLFVSASILEEPIGNSSAYVNAAIYYGFNINGDYIGCVKTNVLNIKPPSQIEIEYWANEQYENQGNMTVLTKEVIKEIFEDKCFDGLKVRNGFPVSNIESIMVAINDDNYASLALAKKLGFNEQGYLQKSEYLLSKNNSIGLKY
ncbi:MAG: GNAT family N-acetyltransferase [Firmicutes bacterium]|nr:GNAT family N-acetyltransferase [Bacillota bacterium]